MTGRTKEANVKKFSAKYLRSLSCPAHLKQHYQRILPGVNLYISVSRSGSKAFTFRKKVDGQYRVLDLGCRFNETLDDQMARVSMDAARKKATELTALWEQGINVFDQARMASHEPTLQDLFDHYRREQLEKKGKRVQDNINNFERWFGRRGLASRKLSDFGHADALRLHADMRKTPGSANRAVQLGKAMFNTGKRTRMIACENPFDGVTFYPEETRERVLSDEEAGRLIQEISDTPDVHCHERTLSDLLMLILLTGVRKQVILTMEWSEIDERKLTWTIPAAKQKNRKEQVIPLGPAEVKVLADRKRLLMDADISSPWVFPSKRSKSGHLVDPGNQWESLRERLGMPDLWIHDLRRSLASSMANTGANVAIVQAALHHTDMRTTLRAYVRTNQQAQLEARMKAQEGWFKAAGRK